MFPLRDNIPTRRFPWVNYLLIAANILFFIKELEFVHQGVFENFLFTYGLIPRRFLENPLANFPTVFTSMFLHGGWAHVMGNMWYLHIFGDNIEDRLGHFRYFIYYLLMGVGAAMAQVFLHPAGQLPMVGASGAIAGVLGGYFMLFPGARVLTFFIFIFFIRIIEIPAFFYLGLWFLTQALNGVGSLTAQSIRGEMGGVAWWAHAGGFLSGFIFVHFFKKRVRN